MLDIRNARSYAAGSAYCCENNVISYQLCVYIPDEARLTQLRSRSSLYNSLSGTEFHGRGIIKRDESPRISPC